MLRALMIGAAAVAVLAASQANQADAQTSGTLTLHNKGRFQGARRAISGPRQHIEPAFLVKSVQVPAGTQWELCSGATFSGCRQFSQSDPSMVMTVRSVRPIAAVLPSTAMAPGQVSGRVAGDGRSLRGVASEYFIAPDQGGSRVEVQPGTGEAMTRRAIEFCRARGWRTSAHERLQSVAGRFFLTDVLCVNETGR